MEKDYLTIEEAANKLGVHPKTIRRYISNGKLSAQKIAGSWRINRASMEAYLSACEGSDCSCQSVSKDDFCIFMDNDYFSSNEILQACTIVDYYVQGDAVKSLLKDVMEAVAEQSLANKSSRFNYVYDDAEQKMRLVFWGSPSYMEKVLSVMKPYEN
jgi:excisionase family DNA binding protein